MKTHKLSWVDWVLIVLMTPLLYLLGWTLRIKEEGLVEWGPRAHPSTPPLWALWHETILTSVWHHRHQKVCVMISASRDGELVSTLARFLGYTPIRGSSSRGGQNASREMVEALKSGRGCAITPDGPRGPRREIKMGTVQIARMAHSPVVPFGFAVEKGWRLKSWDQFIIPKPFTRGVFVYGEPQWIIPAEGGEAESLEKIKLELDRVTQVAENYFGKQP